MEFTIEREVFLRYKKMNKRGGPERVRVAWNKQDRKGPILHRLD